MWKGSPDPGQPLVNTKFDNLQFPLVAVLGAVATLPPCNDGHQFREFGLKEESSLDHSLGECWGESVHSHWPLRNTAPLRDITLIVTERVSPCHAVMESRNTRCSEYV